MMPPAPLSGATFASEPTPVGDQSLVPGVRPITPRDRLALRADAPLVATKRQKPADHGLFDLAARDQLDLFLSSEHRP